MCNSSQGFGQTVILVSLLFILNPMNGYSEISMCIPARNYLFNALMETLEEYIKSVQSW